MTILIIFAIAFETAFATALVPVVVTWEIRHNFPPLIYCLYVHKFTPSFVPRPT